MRSTSVITLGFPALVACAQPGATPAEDAVDTADVLDQLDCVEDDAAFSQTRVEDTEVATVKRLGWNAGAPEDAGVAYTFDDGELWTTAMPAQDEDGLVVVLRGVPASTTVRYRLTDAATGTCSAVRTYDTDALPAALPELDHSGTTDPATGFVSMPVLTEDASFITTLDSRGRYVWAMPTTGPTPFRFAFDKHAQGFTLNEQATVYGGTGAVVHMAWDGHELSRYEVENHHTDYAQGRDREIYALTWDIREFQHEGVTRRILGDGVVRVEQDGTTTQLWNSFEQFGVNLDESWEEKDYGNGHTAEDWSHVNQISFDEDSNTLLLSVPNLAVVTAIDASTGQTRWVLGESPDSLVSDVEEPVNMPHSVYMASPDEVVIFNRMEMGAGCSRADTFHLDMDAGTAELVSSYDGGECLAVYYLGEARPMADGGTQVVWTTSGRMDLVDADGELYWSVVAKLGAGMAYSGHASGLYGE